MSKSEGGGRQVASHRNERELNMRYACLIYFDPRKVFNQSPEGEAVLRDSMDPNSELRTTGQIVMEGPLDMPDQAMTLQVRDGKMSTTDGPFMETKEMLGGFVVIEARDLNEAVRIGAKIPLARLGFVEVRPFVDFSKPRPKL
jgi:hypothetical protein